jgi:isoquinoline 1-oxidoreductase beta subunit
MPQLSRRSFVVSVAALGGGLALGFHLPTGARPARAAASTAEVNAWVVIQPDDAVVIRVARSEMGQGITTSLPMLVAEEFECDWNKVRAEFPTADENLRRHRAWGACRPAAAGRCEARRNTSARRVRRPGRC